MRDRFTDSTRELSEKNAFVCDSCGERSILHREHPEGRTVDERQVREDGLHVSGLDIGGTLLERTIHSDPTPFGP